MRAFALFLALAGCIPSGPSNYGLAFGSLAASPVVVTQLRVNGADFQLVPVVVDARSDQVMPRASGLYSMQYPANGQTLSLDAAWVEIPTGRAYTATLSVPVKDLERMEDSVYIMPIFGPNGLFLVASDPVPTSEADQPTRDLAQVCGARSPANDTDYRAAPDGLPDLAGVISDARPAVGETTCPTPKE